MASARLPVADHMMMEMLQDRICLLHHLEVDRVRVR